MSRFEEGGFHSEESSRRERGFDEKDQAWFALGERLSEVEEKLHETTHDALARWHKDSHERNPPRELLLALALVGVFIGSTRLAEYPSVEQNVRVSSDGEKLPPTPLASQDEIARLSRSSIKDSSPHLTISLFGRGDEIVGDLFVVSSLDATTIVNGTPLVFNEPVSSFSIDRLISKKEAQRLSGSHALKLAVLEEEGVTQEIFIDKNDNQVRGVYMKDEESGEIRERIDVRSKRFFPSSEAPSLIPWNIDLSELGYGSIDGAFYTPVLSEVGKDHQYTYFASKDSVSMVSELKEARGEEIAVGIHDALALFGLSDDKISGVTVIDRPFMNAYADSRTRPVIYFTDEILKERSQKSFFEAFVYGEGLTKEAVSYIAAHEVFHQIDFVYGITSSEKIQNLFQRISSEELSRVNERRDGSLLGGHAQDNEKELFASFMNTIRDGHWQRRLVWMSLEDLLVYHEVVDEISERLLPIPELESAPVHRLLSVRKKFIKERIRDLRRQQGT